MRRLRRYCDLCEEILREVEAFGGRGVMTSPDLASGTDRVAVVARELADVQIVVNVQGDEPELRGETIDRVVALLEENPDVPMATLATPIRRRQQLEDPACVKVVCDGRGRALDPLRIHPACLQCVRPTANGRERRSELVREHGQELVL